MIFSSVNLLFFMSVISWWLTDFTSFRPVRLVGGRSRIQYPELPLTVACPVQ